MANISFDNLIKSLHDGTGEALKDAETRVISINEKRQFIVPEGYNLDLAYEGDVNSQIVSFRLPKKYEGHNLVDCGTKIINWKNLISGNEDWSELIPFIPDWIDKLETEKFQFLKWIVPPAAFTKAGTIQVSISIYDFQDNKLAFAWNTAPFSGFNVRQTLTEIGYKGENSVHPTIAKNELLYIDEERHNIVAPQGYNFVFSTYGSNNTATLHFQTVDNLGGIELSDNNTIIKVITKIKDRTKTSVVSKDSIHSSFYDTLETKKGLIEFNWIVPEEVISNDLDYTGVITISLEVENGNKKWKTLPFSKLILGQSLEDTNEQILHSERRLVIDASMNSTLEEKNIGGIVCLKTLTETEWDGLNYTPAKGEKIIYAVDSTHANPREKVGDGVTLAKNLPFIVDPTVPSWARAETFEYTYSLTEEDIDRVTQHFLEIFDSAEEYEG